MDRRDALRPDTIRTPERVGRLNSAARDRSHAQPQERSDAASMARTHLLSGPSTLAATEPTSRRYSGNPRP